MRNLSIDSLSLLLFCSDLLIENNESLTSDEWLAVEKALNAYKKTPAYLMDLKYDTLTNILGISQEISYKILSKMHELPSLLHAIDALNNENIFITTKYEDDFPMHSTSEKNTSLFLYYSGNIQFNNDVVSLLGTHLTKRRKEIIDPVLFKLIEQEASLLLTDSHDYPFKEYLKMGGHVILLVSDHLFDLIHHYKKLILSNQLTVISITDPYSYHSLYDQNALLELLLELPDFSIITECHNDEPLFKVLLDYIEKDNTKQLIYNNHQFTGNRQLISIGGTPYTDEDIQSVLSFKFIFKKNIVVKPINIKEEIDQMDIFDFIN